jgi:Domain of Unknown Function (DUF349)
MRFMHLVAPLSRLFRSASPVAPSPQDKAAALDSGPPELIDSTALGGGDASLRAAAILKLQDGEVLRKLAGLSGDASPPAPASPERTAPERMAQNRMAQLLDAGAIDFGRLCETTENTSALLAIAGLSGNPAHLPQALALIEDPNQVATLVLEGSSSRIRQFAAQTIEDPAELKQLLKQLRGKDKSVYKIIKQKCDALRAEEQRIAQIDSDIDALGASLERHSHRIYDALYAPSLRQFEAQWTTLESQARPQARERVHRGMEACREVIAAHERQLAEQAAAAAHQEALRAAQAQAAAHAAEEDQRRSETAAHAAADAAAAREAEEKARSEKLAAEALALRQLSALIGKANGALRDGNTGQASGLRRAIEEKLQAMPAVPAHLTSQVQHLDAKLNEFKEWKEHAVAPKRAELIQEMEALIGSSEEPKALADRIKQLQDDWKTISKGILSDSEADWQRFHQASVTAYQPCREYFEAQAKLRQTNLDRRREVLERLRAFETAQSGEHPDWRAVAAVLREARQEWRQHFPVDRAAGLAVQEEFDASLGRLQARLDAWYAENVAEKKTLIQRAQALLAKEDGREAMEAVKRLQLLWKDVGTAPRDQEQPLWNEFREHCDAVYQKRQQAHAEYAAGLEANKAQAVAICDEAEKAAGLAGPELLEGVGKIPQWRAAFEALGEMPGADQRALHDRLERALKLCQSNLQRQRARDKEQSFADLLEAARHIQAYGRAARIALSADRESLKQAADTFIAGVQLWPKDGAEALDQAWANAQATTSLDSSAHETELRMLCIRSEILADLPTPPEDQALRRDFQMQRLVRRMGQHGEAGADELDAMALEWVRVGPASAGIYESLLARFLRCRRGI